MAGLQAAVRAVPFQAVAATAVGTHWPSALAGLLRSALWGRFYLSFSKTTLNIMLGLTGAGLLLRALKLRTVRASRTEMATVVGLLIFLTVLIYAMVLFATLAELTATSYPWCAAGLLPGAFVLTVRGFAVWPGVGVWCARASIVIAAYIAAGTWFAKLIPAYAGFDVTRAQAGPLSRLYTERAADVAARLGETVLVGGAVALPLVCADVAGTLVLGVWIWRCLRKRGA